MPRKIRIPRPGGGEDVITIDDGGEVGGAATGSGTLLYGEGAPDNSVGENGQFYVNKLNGDLWGPKDQGKWPVSAAGSLSGGGAMPAPDYVPDPATGLGINLVNAGIIIPFWNASPAADFDHFELYRHTSLPVPLDVGHLLVSQAGTSYNDQAFDPTQEYYYALVVVDAADQDSDSATVGPVTHATLYKPTQLALTPGDQSIAVDWNHPNPAIPSWEVRYSTDGGSTWSAWVDTGSADTNYLLTGLQNGVEHKVQVRATWPGVDPSITADWNHLTAIPAVPSPDPGTEGITPGLDFVTDSTFSNWTTPFGMVVGTAKNFSLNQIGHPIGNNAADWVNVEVQMRVYERTSIGPPVTKTLLTQSPWIDMDGQAGPMWVDVFLDDVIALEAGKDYIYTVDARTKDTQASVNIKLWRSSVNFTGDFVGDIFALAANPEFYQFDAAYGSPNETGGGVYRGALRTVEL